MTPSTDRPLRIAAYLRPRGLINPTGVGKHQLNMILELSRRPDCSVTLLAPRGDLVDGQLPVRTPLDALPIRILPGSCRSLEFLWTFAAFLPMDRFFPSADWVYAPFEILIPSRHARQAATFHCVNWFESELPWYNDPAIARARRRLGPVFRQISRKAHCVLTVSDFLSKRIEALLHCDTRKIHVVCNGIENAFLSHAGGEAPPYPFPYLIVAAPLVYRKGAEYVFRLAAALRRYLPDLRIVAVGAKHSHGPMLTEAACHPNILIEDYMDLTRLPTAMYHAAAYLALSRYETFGIPAAEAMAVGTPVIASHFAGLPEVVGDAGIVVDPADSGHICEIIADLMKDRARRTMLVAKGRLRARSFTWDSCANRLVQALRSTQ